MQSTKDFTKGTMGEMLFELSKAEGEEKQSLLEILEDKIITKYPDEEKILMLLVKEALKGKTKATLASGVLAPDFSEESIKTEVLDKHTVVFWDE